MTTTPPPTRRNAHSARPAAIKPRPRPRPEPRAPRPPGRIRPIAWTLLLLGVSLAVLSAALAGTFSVHHITVVGAPVPVSTVVAATDLEGTNIFSVRTDRIVAQLQQVHDVTVQRVETAFPDTVTIYVQPRRGMVAWRRGTALFVLDSYGRIIKQTPTTSLPIITSTGNEPSLTPGVVEAVRVAVDLLPRAPNGALSGFAYDRKSGLTISSAAGWRAVLGNGTPRKLVTRVATLAAFLQKTKANPPRSGVIEFRFGTAYYAPTP